MHLVNSQCDNAPGRGTCALREKKKISYKVHYHLSINHIDSTICFSPYESLHSILRGKSTVFEAVHEISNNVVCATSKGSVQPAHTRSLIRAFASRLNIL